MIGKEWVRETVTVVAKTYPEYSQKYGSLVCTAGINSQGQWRRLYPIPWALFFADYSRLNFKKWDVISVPTRKKTRDRRHESYEVDPYNIHQELQVLDHLPPWEARVRFLEPYLDPDLETLWNTDRSLGVIKPKSITDFIQKERHDVTEPGEVLTMQQLLLPDVEPELIARSRNEPTHLPWLGYKFFCNGRCFVIGYGIGEVLKQVSNVFVFPCVLALIERYGKAILCKNFANPLVFKIDLFVSRLGHSAIIQLLF